jgi:Ca-activated chloride channel homolog
MKKLLFSCIIVSCIPFSSAFAADTSGIVKRGNKLYKDQKYNDALKSYEQALEKQPDSSLLNFNAGAAHYKTNDFEKAVSSFEKAVLTEDKPLEAKANYNLGNARYMLGLSKENSDLSSAVQALEGSLKNYTRAQEMDPKDTDAKTNYPIVEKKLKELKEKLEKQPQNSDSDKDKKDQDKKDQQNQEDKQKQSAEQQKKQEEGQKKTEEQKQEAEQQQKQDSQSGEAKEMSKEEAQMLLEGFRQEEDRFGMLKDDRKGTEEKVDKDW